MFVNILYLSRAYNVLKKHTLWDEQMMGCLLSYQLTEYENQSEDENYLVLCRRLVSFPWYPFKSLWMHPTKFIGSELMKAIL